MKWISISIKIINKALPKKTQQHYPWKIQVCYLLDQLSYSAYSLSIVADVEFPESGKYRLRVMEKVPQYPVNLRPYKMQKRLRYMRGPEEVHNNFQHRQFGIVADIGGRMKHGHFEMARLTISRFLPPGAFAIWRIDPPWQPVTKKVFIKITLSKIFFKSKFCNFDHWQFQPIGTRMGGGKAAIHHYVTPIKAGRVILEVAGSIEYYQVNFWFQIFVSCICIFGLKCLTFKLIWILWNFFQTILRF